MDGTNSSFAIFRGLSAAQTVFYRGRVNEKRDNVQQAIIVYASVYR